MKKKKRRVSEVGELASSWLMDDVDDIDAEPAVCGHMICDAIVTIHEIIVAGCSMASAVLYARYM